jgi:ribosome biogenesis GTPase
VDFRHNRQKPARRKQWAVPLEHDEQAEDTATHESVRAKGELSRRRTITEKTEAAGEATRPRRRGRAVAVRGQYVDVDDGERNWPCTVRRVLRTRRIESRSPVTVGDEVLFSIVADARGVLNEGVIEEVAPRRTMLTRSDGRRTHTIAANMDQVLIVTSLREPMLKPHLIDRYLVAAHAGGLDAIICLNKIDLGTAGEVDAVRDRYERIGYRMVATSARTGDGVDRLREHLAGKATLLAGQSGVGKSSLLNAVEPGLGLRVGEVSWSTEKGQHTTTTAVWIPWTDGAVIDTPGIRALEVAMVPLHELEMHFVEFADRVRDCRFPDCTHLHEDGCAIKNALERGEIDRSRYQSYERLFEELSDVRRASYE